MFRLGEERPPFSAAEVGSSSENSLEFLGEASDDVYELLVTIRDDRKVAELEAIVGAKAQSTESRDGETDVIFEFDEESDADAAEEKLFGLNIPCVGTQTGRR